MDLNFEPHRRVVGWGNKGERGFNPTYILHKVPFCARLHSLLIFFTPPPLMLLLLSEWWLVVVSDR